MTAEENQQEVVLGDGGVRVRTTTQRIWKYDLPIVSHFTLELPKGARILDVQVQRKKTTNNLFAQPDGTVEVPCLWAIVEPANEKEKRHFFLRGTGQSVLVAASNKWDAMYHLNYVGTFQLHNGEVVMHLFEVPSVTA